MAVNKVVYGNTTLIDITDTTAVASDVAQGKYFYTADGVKREGTSSGGGSVVVTERTLAGGGIEKIITAEVVNLQTKIATPSESAQSITPDTGYTGLSEVTVGAISSTYVGSGITQRSSSDLTASGDTVTVPSGYYSSQVSKSVTSGSAGTPSATKGTVSNHSVTVTPSVTNTTGYITGGTKTGTGVTVSASELVSGSQTVTQNGTVDVTNLASVTVNVSGGGGKAIQHYNGLDYSRSTSYVETDVALTVAKTGSYNISWIGWRSSSSGTSGSQLYKNGSALGSAYTTFSGTYGQRVSQSNVSLSAGDELVVYARARGTQYYMYVSDLIIEEV
ncbi:MAG: hypothetical protein IJH05_03445 [Firmicutes bacterium]|nr:hypothetical protein [Bacillota bacterium]